MIHRADTSPNNDPTAAELAGRIEFIESHIDKWTDRVEPYVDEDGWVIQETFKHCKDNTIATFQRMHVPADGFTERSVSYTLPSGESRSFTSTDREDSDFGKYLIYVDLGVRGDEEIKADSVEDAAQKNNFVGRFSEIYEFIASGKLDEEKHEYARHDLPGSVEVLPIGPAELADFRRGVQVDPVVAHMAGMMEPVAIMRADTGETWLASGVRDSDQRKYVVLYRAQDKPTEPYQAHVVYTSLSQATWRLLPKLGEPGNPNWHYKTMSEELITLPAQMQGVLWNYAEEAPAAEVAGRDDFFDAVADLGDEKFDTFLAGIEADVEYLYQTEMNEAKLPLASANDEQVISSFYAPLYGNIDMRIVPSRDGTLDYYTYTRRSDGMRWIGMIQTHDAKMLDSFLLDKVVVAPGFYASPQEYGEKKDDGTRDYEDNSGRVLGNIAVKALDGLL